MSTESGQGHIGIGVGKVIVIGGVPIKLEIEYDSYIARANDFGPRHAFFFSVTPVLPRLIEGPLFQ